MKYTTLNQIRRHSPCASGWTTLLKGLGKTEPDDEPLALTTILAINGLADAIWCLRTLEGADREMRPFAVGCARQVQHLMTDPRSLAALEVAERFANGQATQEELAAARDEVRDAAWDAANIVWAISSDAAYEARAAAYEARDATYAARAATYASSDASSDAADAADAARDAARAIAGDEAMAKQEQLFREHFG